MNVTEPVWEPLRVAFEAEAEEERAGVEVPDALNDAEDVGDCEGLELGLPWDDGEEELLFAALPVSEGVLGGDKLAIELGEGFTPPKGVRVEEEDKRPLREDCGELL